MAKRIGALVTFKAGVTRAQAAKALGALAGMIDERITYPSGDYDRPVRTADPAAFIEEYDDRHGSGPVWYIP